MRIGRRILVAGMCCALIALAASGAAAQKASAASRDSVTITYWTMLDPNGTDPRSTAERQIIQAFMKENPNIQVNVQSFAWNQLPQQTILATQAGQGPDVARVSFGQTLGYVTQNTLLPLNRFLTKADQKDMLGEKAVFNGNWLGMIWSPVPNGILYRTDLFKKTGLPVPKTWVQLQNVLKAMSSSDVAGFGFGLRPGQDLLYTYFMPYLWGAHYGGFTKNWKASFANKAGVDAFQWLNGLVQNGIMPKSVVNMGANDVMDAFRAGKFAAIIDSASRVTYAESSDVTRGNVGVWRFPSPDGKGSPPFMLSWFIGISKTTKHPQAAWKLVKFMTGKEADVIKASVSGELPSRASSLSGKWFATHGNDNSQDFLNYLKDYTHSPQAYMGSPELFHSLLIQALQSVIVNGVSPQAALANAQSKFNAGG